MNNETMEGMRTILQKWEDICKDKAYNLQDKTEMTKWIGTLGEVYALYAQEHPEMEEEVFIEEALNNETIKATLQNVNQKTFITTCIRAGIYKIHFLQSIAPIYAQETVNAERKIERICKEYIFQNNENLYDLEKIMALSFILDEPVEKVAERIQNIEDDMMDAYDYWVDDEEEDE